MAQQTAASIENNFTKGLITESTGLNFPENAATDCDNCEFTLIGDVNRRLGIDHEIHNAPFAVSRFNQAVSTYKWNNVGGDGLTQIVVEQIGSALYFYRSSDATNTSPLSTTKLSSTVSLIAYTPVNGNFDVTTECQFTDGNGYLFVYHPSIDPVYCTYNSGVITPNPITVQLRDFTGITENIDDSTRPTILNLEHNYNLINQGWVAGNPWSATSASVVTLNLGSTNFTVAAGIVGIVLGSQVTIITLNAELIGFTWVPAGTHIAGGTVTGYSGTTLTININDGATSLFGFSFATGFTIVPRNTAYLTTWNATIGNYPSNADVWWYFKNASGVFDPTTTVLNTSIGTGKAPKGHFILNAFNQSRSVISGLAVTNINTNARPSTGCWFQGRVWYTGVNAQQPAIGDASYYTWTENIYFSQIVQNVNDFGKCYQQNDPTSETLFDLLSTDGGVITIQGCGAIYKLFPLQNALLVFAANGVWYLTGSQGIGFTANDYTIVKLSSVQSISNSSFVDVQGMPMFWNEEGIYKGAPAKQGTGLLSNPLHVNPLEVIPVTLGTILSFYSKIPLSSKKHAKGAYHPINYIVQWLYKDNEAVNVTDTYEFNKILNYNNSNNAFFPYTINPTNTFGPTLNSIVYLAGPGGSVSPPPVLKYVSSRNEGPYHSMGFADEHDTNYVDWASNSAVNYTSYFVTGYKLKGQAIKKFQPQYIQVYSRLDGSTCGYKIQGIWNYALTGNSGKISNLQTVTILGTPNFGTYFKRHKIRGNGYALQFKITSSDGLPFDIQGWAVMDTVNAGT
jgi:hypothetical protein